MLYGILYGIIALVAAVFFFIDWFLAKIDSSTEESKDRKERVDSSMRSLLMVMIPIAIMVALWLIRDNLLHLNLVSLKQLAVLVFEVFWLMLLRKILVILTPSIFSVICYQTPSFAQDYEHFVIYKGHGISIVTRSGMTLLAVIMFMMNLITTVFQSLSLSRLNVITHRVTMLAEDTIDKPAITAVWFLLMMAFWTFVIMTISAIIMRIRNQRDNGTLKKPNAWYELIDLRITIIAALVLIPVRKVYDWIAVMRQYRLEDILFWVVIWLIAAVIFLIRWLRHQPASNS